MFSSHTLFWCLTELPNLLYSPFFTRIVSVFKKISYVPDFESHMRFVFIRRFLERDQSISRYSFLLWSRSNRVYCMLVIKPSWMYFNRVRDLNYERRINIKKIMSFITPEKISVLNTPRKEIIDGTIFLGIKRNKISVLITSPRIIFLFFYFFLGAKQHIIVVSLTWEIWLDNSEFELSDLKIESYVFILLKGARLCNEFKITRNAYVIRSENNKKNKTYFCELPRYINDTTSFKVWEIW